MRIGHGFDAHRLVAGRKCILGGIEVAYDRGPLGHSDGDAVAHAIADALFGAAALGDLGAHFPPEDARWKDADSLALLRACGALVRERGHQIGNVDCTIVLEQPRLSPLLGQMQRRLSEALGIEPGDVSVKVKTSEGMGYTGDGTGVAVYAVALLT
ncbi:MAG: 2-C-methyl-D-erythritol 2,4-cyclodiphosphate synthase [Vulcanimicrobiaceae bacterium]